MTRDRHRRTLASAEQLGGDLMAIHVNGESAGQDLSPRRREPCEGCGEETAVGSIFFSDRRRVEHPDGHRSYVCRLCDERLAADRHGRRLTDEELTKLINMAGIAGQAWGGRSFG